MTSPQLHSSIEVVPTANVRATVTPRRKSDSKTAQTLQFDQVNLFQWLNRVANECESLEQLLKGCTEVICCQTECLGLWVTQRGENKSFDQIYSILDEPGSIKWDSVAGQGQKMIKLAHGSRQIQTGNLPRNETRQLIVVPVIDEQDVETMIAGCFHRAKDAPRHNEMLLGILAQTISNWMSKLKLNQSEVRTRSLNDVVSLSRELDGAKNLHAAALILVNQVKRLANARQVAFASCNRNNLPKLLAISDVETIDDNYAGIKAMNGACAQSMQLRQMIIYPDRRKTGVHSDTQPLQQYCKSSGYDACISIPVVTGDDELIGSILLAISPKQAVEECYTNYLGQLTQMLSGHLDVVLKANQSLKHHALASIRKKLTGRYSKIVAAVVLGLAAFMLIPWPYRIGCDCEIQPVLRRFIAAPHDGVLQKNLVENGDVVKQNEVVACLDDRQLRMELVGLEAELQGTTKKRSATMADGAIAQAQIALSDMKKLKSEIELVKDKLQNLEIRSPIDGIIVAGDLEKVEGAPVEMGQTLFEVGPLDQMLAEIAVPEQEIPYVKPGMRIDIKLNAYPFETWTGTVAKIHPKSEVRDQESVFIAEVQLENNALNLKPGMKGQAKIKSNAYPIGWNLFHRPLEQIRYWTIW